jgi:DNA-directed RNA polymerase specialized sigma24 family protein
VLLCQFGGGPRAEECQRLLSLLGEAELQSIALRKMEGYSIEEIAEKHSVVPRTVKRKLRRIRHIWEQELQLSFP